MMVNVIPSMNRSSQHTVSMQDYDRSKSPSAHAGMQLLHACAENMLFLDSTAQSLFNDKEASSWSPPDVVAASEDDKVQLMTMHKSKGLEFSVVFLLGLSSAGTAMRPQTGSAADDFELQEAAKNLVYVGVTRAKDCLVASSHTRLSRNAPHAMRAEMYHGGPSIFLEAMYKEWDGEGFGDDDLPEPHLLNNPAAAVAMSQQLGYPKHDVRLVHVYLLVLYDDA